jgi:L-ascorbate metabolism protein UlaG (beta-lactamase superfamily)
MMDLKITYVTHACIKIEGEFGSLLLDPWFLNEPIFNCTTWKYPPAVIPPNELLANLDYLFITHAHEDHFHIPSIDYISRDVKVLLPEYVEHPGLRAQTVERVMRALEFSSIRKITPWKPYRLGAETTLTVIPTGEVRAHDWENAGIVIEHPGCTLVNMNDNVGDADLYREIARRFPHVDVGMVASVGVTMFPGCYKMSAEQMRTEAKRRKFSYGPQRLMVEHLKPKRIVPFASDFCWLDDRYYHNNWAARSTPAVFVDWVETEFPHIDIEAMVMNPSDTWSRTEGLVRNSLKIDWNDYLTDIERLKRRFQPKVDRYAAWIEDSFLEDLEQRSRSYTANINKWICQDFIEFSARFRIAVEGDRADFMFVLKASPDEGFKIDWDDHDDVDQTLYVPQAMWGALLEGKVMWNMMQWASLNEQHVPYRLDIGRFWFWMEYYIDLNNRNCQVIIDPVQFGEKEPRIRPAFGSFPMENDWQLPDLDSTDVPVQKRAKR